MLPFQIQQHKLLLSINKPRVKVDLYSTALLLWDLWDLNPSAALCCRSADKHTGIYIKSTARYKHKAAIRTHINMREV